MRRCIFIGLVGLFIFSITDLCAQHKHKMEPYFKGRYKSIKVPRSKKKTICPGYNGAEYPYQALGFKLGDPIDIKVKGYRLSLRRNEAAGIEITKA